MNYFNKAEKTLKSCLKEKLSITTATVIGFLIAGTAVFGADGTYTVNEENTGEDNIKIEVNDTYGIISEEGVEGSFGGENLDIKVTNTGNTSAIGIKSLVKPGSEDLNSKINLGDKNTKNIKIDVKNDGEATGIFVHRKTGSPNNSPTSNASVVTEGENLFIDVYSKENYATGIWVQNGTDGTEGNKSDAPVEVIINSKNTVINAKSENGYSEGLVVFSEGKLEINGNLEVNADAVLETRGNSTTVINKDGKNTVKLNGDILFSYNDKTSQTTRDANVTINLSNSESYFNGNIMKISDIENIPEEKDKVTGMKLGLSNGAQWNTDADSFVNTLTFNNGIININGGNDHTVQIDKIVGNGGNVNIKTSVIDGGFDAGTFNVDEAIEGTSLDVNFTGITADDITTKEFGELAKGHVTGDGLANLDTTVKVEEGLTEGAITGELGVNGVTNLRQNQSTNTIDGLANIGAINFLTWRQEMSSLNQRMGELRDTQGTSGVWARVYGGEFELDNRFKNEYQTYQVGYDKNYDYAGGKLFLGYLFSYTDGSTDYDLGSGDNNSFGAGLYGTWLNNTGHYVDVIAKVNRLHNEYDVYSSAGVQSKGDYTNYGVSLSAEYGKRFTMDRVFVEPSIRMDLGKVGHRSYTTSSGVRVDQDSIYTTQGVVGAKLGYKLNKGNIYARLSGVKEFAGDIDMSFNGKNPNNLPDFEDEWLELGVGGNYRVAENVNLYLDLSKTTNATVDTNWQANLGFRYEF